MNKEERVRDSRFKFSRSSNESSNLPSFEEEGKKRRREERRGNVLPFDPSRKLFTFDETGRDESSVRIEGGGRNGRPLVSNR